MLTLINSVENSLHFLYKTVDTDTELLKNVSDQLADNSSLKHRAFNFGTLHEQIDRKNDYITGKMGIGPYALNVTNQELTRLNRVKFASTNVTRSTRISRLDNMVDVNDNPIAAPGVKSLNFLPIKSGVITFKSPLYLVTIERTGTKSFSSGLAIGVSGYTFPLGAVLPKALYLGIKSPGLSKSSPS